VFFGKLDHIEVAIKKLNNPDLDRDTMSELLREAGILAELSHIHVVRLFGTWTDASDGATCLVLEYANLGSLHDALYQTNNNTSISGNESKKLAVIQGILCGLKYVHGRDVAHRDIKSENVLLYGTDNCITAKLADFGHSKLMVKGASVTINSNMCGTWAYMSPELLNGSLTNNLDSLKRVDVYAVGVLLNEVLTESKPFSHTDMQPPQIVTAVTGGQRPPLLSSSQEGRSEFDNTVTKMVEKAWHKNPQTRPSAFQLYQKVAQLTIISTTSGSSNSSVGITDTFSNSSASQLSDIGQ
jgi:serine/threonine protein kinase